MAEFKTPRHAIPCSDDPEYNHSSKDREDFCCPPEPEPPNPKPQRHHKNEIKFACGNGSGLSLPVFGGALSVTQGAAYSFPSLIAGSVSLDTSKLVDPTVKIDFSSIVNFIIDISAYQVGVLISIDFRLIKICDGNKVPLGTWTYHKSVNAGGALPGVESNGGLGLEVDFREPFNFSWCECQECPGCCTYVVEISNVNSFGIASASLTNVSISALAVG